MGTKTNISIRNQLILVVGLITTFIIIATGLVRSWNTYDQKQNELIRSTSILAAVTADNTTAALSFGDIDSATELLAALKQEPAIREAGVFDNQGELFVRYRAAGVAQPYLTSNYQQFDEGVSFAKRYFMVTQPVMNKGARLGTVVLRTTMQPAYESLQRTLLWELVTLIVCVLTAIFLAFRFQGLISKPLLNLSNVAKDVSDNKDYSVRVGVDQGPAEVQRLIVAFNTMLDQVQTHDEELAQANRQLEERVKVRTKELEEANRSMEMVQFAVQNAQTAILILDKDGDVIEINNKARELFPKNNVDLIESIHGWEFNKWSDLWDKLIEEETLSEYDLLLTGSGVENLPIELFAAYLDYHDNNYVCLFIRDISQRKLVESRLSQAQKLESIGQLASGIAHEINTPIQYVGDSIGFLEDAFKKLLKADKRQYETLKEGLSSSDADTLVAARKEDDIDYLVEEIPDALATAIEGVSSVSHVVKAMKDFARPRTETKQPADINELIETTAVVSRSEWKYVAELETKFAADLPMVPCLAGELAEVILNLFVNAAHAISESNNGDRKKGKILVSTRVQANRVVIEVSDTGQGIPDEIKDKIFDPFFTTKKVGTGTGQGLSVSHDVIVNKHGGEIRVDSTYGEGATFTITLPLK